MKTRALFGAFLITIFSATVFAQSTQTDTSSTSTTSKKSKKKSKHATDAADQATSATSAATGAASSAATGAAAAGSSGAKTAKSATNAAVTPAEVQAAKASGKVWVNTDTGVYHKGGQYYGNTKQGKFMTEQEAQAAGYRAAKNEGTSK